MKIIRGGRAAGKTHHLIDWVQEGTFNEDGGYSRVIVVLEHGREERIRKELLDIIHEHANHQLWTKAAAHELVFSVRRFISWSQGLRDQISIAVDDIQSVLPMLLGNGGTVDRVTFNGPVLQIVAPGRMQIIPRTTVSPAHAALLGDALWQLDQAVEACLLADAAGTPPPLHALDELRGRLWAGVNPVGDYLKNRSYEEIQSDLKLADGTEVDFKLAHEVGKSAPQVDDERVKREAEALKAKYQELIGDDGDTTHPETAFAVGWTASKHYQRTNK